MRRFLNLGESKQSRDPPGLNHDICLGINQPNKIAKTTRRPYTCVHYAIFLSILAAV
jgi:hypothetical protein